MSSFFLKRVGLLPLKFDIPILVRLVRVGAPATVERLIFSLGGSLYIAVVTRCGAVATAAHQVGVRIGSLIFMPVFLSL
ncbi:MAG: hypothetical protein N3G79_04885 [Sulfolobales archaeon]|nr:hypothetical protein [Sulfolobales archaeon]